MNIAQRKHAALVTRMRPPTPATPAPPTELDLLAGYAALVDDLQRQNVILRAERDVARELHAAVLARLSHVETATTVAAAPLRTYRCRDCGETWEGARGLNRKLCAACRRRTHQANMARANQIRLTAGAAGAPNEVADRQAGDGTSVPAQTQADRAGEPPDLPSAATP